MWITFFLVVGSVLLVVSGFTWVVRRESLDRARAIEALRPTDVESLSEPRMVAVRARAAALDEPLTDPVTDAPVVYYEARLARTDGGERALRTLGGGEAFALEGGSARAEVRLAGAELALPWEEREASDREPSPRMKALLEEAKLEVPAPDRSARYVIFHRAIGVGDELTVVGTPSFEGSKSTTQTGYRGGAGALPLFEANGAALIVTDGGLDALQERERGDMRAMSLMLRIAVAIGVIAVGVGATLVALGA